MTCAYHYDKDFRQFVRSICGLVFVPLDKLDDAIDVLKAVTFRETSRYYTSIVAFQPKALDYLDRVWMK